MLILSSIYLSNYYYHYVKFNKFSRKEYSTHPSPDALLIASSLLHEQMKPFHQNLKLLQIILSSIFLSNYFGKFLISLLLIFQPTIISFRLFYQFLYFILLPLHTFYCFSNLVRVFSLRNFGILPTKVLTFHIDIQLIVILISQ